MREMLKRSWLVTPQESCLFLRRAVRGCLSNELHNSLLILSVPFDDSSDCSKGNLTRNEMFRLPWKHERGFEDMRESWEMNW